MNKKEAIKYLQQLYPNGGHCWLDEQRMEAIGMAIKALQEEPVSEQNLSNVQRTTKNCKELVSEELEKEPTIHDIVDEHYWEMLGEESVSEDLEKASKEWLAPQLDKSYANYGEVKMMELTHFDGYAMLDAIEFGTKWQKAKDESTTEDLGEYINELSKQFPEVSFAKLSRIAVRAAKWQKEHLWKLADGDNLPEIDMEVIALVQDYPDDKDHLRVVFAHRPDPKGWDAKSIITEKVEHYTPDTYGKGGWNIPNVKWWLDVDKLPNMED